LPLEQHHKFEKRNTTLTPSKKTHGFTQHWLIIDFIMKKKKTKKIWLTSFSFQFCDVAKLSVVQIWLLAI
jgi:hypothetical protein